MYRFRSILLIAVHVILGLGIIIAANAIKMPAWLHESLVIALAFLLLNIAYDRAFSLNAIREYWALSKLPYIIPAMAAGLLIMILPALLALATGILKPGGMQVDTSTSINAIVITLVIVGWEELWFRGIFLNYCERHLSPLALSVIMGALFVLVHMLNPEIDLLKKGPALFGAGALLTILYLYYRSIWVPLGVHFGNNYFSGMVKTPVDNHPFFGGDGYCSAIILLLIFLFFVWRNRG
ncbi:MAG: CPBP family intramembrane metalloprotease, partial [Taibaiella sp.]|nr:CPBP family intramembrane metalloprotease [Taibaiella sp.]